MGLAQRTTVPTSMEAGAEKVLERTAELVPWLSEQAARVEEARRIPDDVAERLFETGLFKLMRPTRFGGFGVSPRFAWEATFNVAFGCSSSAWLAGLTSANIIMLGKFSADAQREIFAPGVSPIVPMLTGGVGQDIEIEPVEGGIVLGGRWRYASGVDISDWLGLLVNIPGSGEVPAPHVVLVPQSEFAIDHTSWRVMGMRGTGSKNIALSKAFIPSHRFLSWAELQAGNKHPTCPNTEPVYEFPLNTANAMSVLAPTLGVANACSDECIKIIRGRVSSGNQQAQINDKIAQVDAGSSAATMSLLRDFLISETAAIENRILQGGPLTHEERGLSRAKVAIASRQALSSAQRLFTALGGSLLPEGTRIERLFRDIHAMSSHFLLQPEPIAEAYGRLLLGLELTPGTRL
ncbi:acyl-CoA dehydrogenase family protein [Bradyrhizobium sp. LTSP849]|jgi:alkylation response protein AidB-like acyl-CoA dehydrogenase|uniref:acyl-CoA dehydrogenase family protein n=1 Tax=Bradyrhizobium sp. LTSP849 TaxID=1615890 RepID=UPI000ADE6C85|nr:acyl-CoA dehydrogenase family protein [Bradyrhizobium sp. LTSP849]